ncbi:MAG: hypothetical protein KME21_14630 [Desmonostoc vinosum HA7617-LM4]|jgi:hypothetical protein|nr:hypothetical protein [Desmonostoc vinosum HA7617-LM4]
MKATILPKLFIVCLAVEFLLCLGLCNQANSELKTRSAILAKQTLFEKGFNPPRTDQPTDSSGAGSRSRLRK